MNYIVLYRTFDLEQLRSESLKMEESSMDTTFFYFETNEFLCRKHVKYKGREDVNETTTIEKINLKLNKNGDKNN